MSEELQLAPLKLFVVKKTVRLKVQLVVMKICLHLVLSPETVWHLYPGRNLGFLGTEM